jgi:hypothetical protein
VSLAGCVPSLGLAGSSAKEGEWRDPVGEGVARLSHGVGWSLARVSVLGWAPPFHELGRRLDGDWSSLCFGKVTDVAGDEQDTEGLCTLGPGESLVIALASHR